jgi:hypothetical protein
MSLRFIFTNGDIADRTTDISTLEYLEIRAREYALLESNSYYYAHRRFVWGLYSEFVRKGRIQNTEPLGVPDFVVIRWQQ